MMLHVFQRKRGSVLMIYSLLWSSAFLRRQEILRRLYKH